MNIYTEDNTVLPKRCDSTIYHSTLHLNHCNLILPYFSSSGLKCIVWESCISSYKQKLKIAISWICCVMCWFSVIHVSQGSVATYVRYGGMSTQQCIANFLLNLTVKNFKNRLRFDEVTAKVWGLCFFWNTVYVYCVYGLCHVYCTTPCTVLHIPFSVSGTCI